jgi:hypothetical protein
MDFKKLKLNSFFDYQLILFHLLLGIISFSIISYGFLFVKSPYFNLETYLLSNFLIIIFMLSAFFAYKQNIKIIDVMLLVFYIYLIPRLVQYSIDPQNIYFSTGSPFTLQELNYGMRKFVSLIFLYLFSIILTNYYFKFKFQNIDAENNDKNNKWYLPIYFIGGFWLLMTIIEYYVYSNPENSIYSLLRSEKANLSNFFKIFLTSFSSDVFFFIFLFFTFLKFSFKQSNLIIFFKFLIITLMIFLYTYLASLMGSRGVGLRIILMVIGIYVFCPKNKDYFYLSASVVLICIISSLFTLNVGQNARISFYEKNKIYVDDMLRLYMSRASKVSENIDSEVYGRVDKLNEIQEVKVKVEVEVEVEEVKRDSHYWLLSRLGYMDNILIALSRKPEENCREKYLNWTYYFKNFVNFLVPGDYYKEALTRTSNVFGLCYRPSNYDYVDAKGRIGFDRTVYTSEVWGIFGLLDIMHGKWCYLIIFIFGILVSIFSTTLSLSRSLVIQIFYAYWLYTWTFIFIFSMGIDHNAMETTVALLRWICFCFIYYIIKNLTKMIQTKVISSRKNY